ncbi:MalY/PatB family protein [Photorhabdus hindustanensis]|uniref:cysteine-S-conjugate beta-lyase n=1 Tax=Photorhabdus hindustanensis TaxID=2918802 RepID=A0A2S8PWH7_9GAMM|nr:MalY/PatB family protein [Photorhabdus hindustanensis]PQQ23304.1 transcriptional regulator [Photorhabdus hindustanensis]
MFDFDTSVNRRGTWCTQWDYVGDRFGVDDLLPFTISDMDFATAPCVIQVLQKRLNHGVFGYSRWQHEEFLGAIRHWYQQRFNCEINTNWAVYGPSVIYMVSQLIRIWSKPGENIVVHTPAYDGFYKVIQGNKRRLLPCSLEKQGNNWVCDMNQLETLLSQPETKILLLCNPHNPTGKAWSHSELKTMSELCERYNVNVISDEIHMDMTLRDTKHIPWSEVATTHWALITSASKSFNLPALTGAYGFINDDHSRAAYTHQLTQSDGLSSPAILAISAYITAYREGHIWLDELRNYLSDNLNYVAQELNAAFPQLNWQPPQATYLAWIDLRNLNIDDDKLQQILIHEEKIAIMPGKIYGEAGKGFLRFNTGCPCSKVELGIQKLISALRKLC